MASKVFQGRASIRVKLEDGVEHLVLVADKEGNWGAENVTECYAKLRELEKSEKLPISKWSIFQPEKLPAKAKVEFVMLAAMKRGKYGPYATPYIGVFKEKPKVAKAEKDATAKVEAPARKW